MYLEEGETMAKDLRSNIFEKMQKGMYEESVKKVKEQRENKYDRKRRGSNSTSFNNSKY